MSKQNPLKNRAYIHFYRIVHKLINKMMWIIRTMNIVEMPMLMGLAIKFFHRVIHMFFKKLSMHFYTANSATENRRDYENNKSL